MKYDKMKYERSLTCKKHYDIREIVYFINKNEGVPRINWGVVADNFSDGTMIELYSMKERRMVDGVLLDDITFPTKWKKLPKSWVYNTPLFTVDIMPFTEEEKAMCESYHLMDKETLEKLVTLGIYKPNHCIENLCYHVESEVDSNMGWRLRLVNNGFGKNSLNYITIPHWNVYEDFDTALQFIQAYNEDLKEIAEMSDYDWSVYNIDRTLKMSGKSEEVKNKIKDFLLKMERVEDIETRISMGEVQWKYEKNKKWSNIEIDTI